MPWELSLSSSQFQVNRMTKQALLFLLGASVTAVYAAYKRRRSSRTPPSTATSSLRASIDQLLQSCFGTPEAIIPFDDPSIKNLRNALTAGAQLAQLCELHCTALRDFTGEHEASALELGCGIGGTTFHLADVGFPTVVGVDPSKERINAANVLKQRGWMRHVMVEEGELITDGTAVIPEDIHRDRVSFINSDLVSLPAQLTNHRYDLVLVNNSALITLCADPKKLLNKLPSLVAPGGIVVIASSYNWNESITPKERWLGGHKDKNKADVWTADAIQEAMDEYFECLDSKDIMTLRRQHRRGYTVEVLNALVWRRR